MPANDRPQPWRDAIAEALPDRSGREVASWDEPDAIVGVLERLTATGRCHVEGGPPAAARPHGALTSVDSVSSDDGAVLVLEVGDAPLRLLKASLVLTFIPHPADTADAGFLLQALAAGAAIDGDAAAPSGADWLQLVLGDADGLLLGAARSIHRRHPMFALQLTRALAKGIYRPGDAERLKYEAQAKSLVQAEYNQAKGPRRSGAMDQADVDHVAWALLQHGLQPTIELLREIHGSGSPSALHPKLKVFYAKLVDEFLTPVPPPAVPEPVRHIWEQLVAASREAATAGLQAEEAALAAARGRVEAQEAALAQERTEMAQAQRAADAAAVTREAHIRHLEGELARVQDALVQAQHTIAGDADQLAETRTELRQARERAATVEATLAARDAALAEQQQALATLRAQLQVATRAVEHSDGLQQERAEHIAALEATLAEQQQRAAAATAAHQEVVGALERTRASADAGAARLTALESDLAAVTRQLGSVEGQLLAAHDERGRLLEQLAQTATLPGRLDALQRQLAEVTAARDRLAAAATGTTRTGAKTKGRVSDGS